MSTYFQYVAKDNIRGPEQCTQGLAADGANADLLWGTASAEVGLGAGTWRLLIYSRRVP